MSLNSNEQENWNEGNILVNPQRQERANKQTNKAQNKIVESNPTISISTININGLNTSVKRVDF